MMLIVTEKSFPVFEVHGPRPKSWHYSVRAMDWNGGAEYSGRKDNPV